VHGQHVEWMCEERLRARYIEKEHESSKIQATSHEKDIGEGPERTRDGKREESTVSS